jgi:hypothetical protein
MSIDVILMRFEIYFEFVELHSTLNITVCAAANKDENDQADDHTCHPIIIRVNSQTKHCGVLLCIKNAGNTQLLPSTHSSIAQHCATLRRHRALPHNL